MEVTQQANGVIFNNKILQSQRASIGFSESGDNEVVAAVANSKIVVLSLYLQSRGTVDGYFHDSDANDCCGDASNPMSWSPTSVGGMLLPYCSQGWFETASGESLELNLSSAVSVSGCLTYILVPDDA